MKPVRAMLLGSLILLLAACGASAGSSQTGTSQSKTPIRIGLTVAETGRLAETASLYKRGYEVAVQVINSAGGVLGRPLQLVMYDDATEPERARSLYERLIERDKVDLLIGPIGSDLVLAAASVADQHKVPMLNVGGIAPNIYQRGYKYLFGVLPTADAYPTGAVKIANEFGYKRVAILATADAFGKSFEAAARKQVQASGMSLVADEEVPVNATDYTPVLGKIKAANPDLFIVAVYLDGLVQVVSQMRQIDFMSPMVFTVGGGSPEFWQLLKDNGNYFLGMSQWDPSLHTPGIGQLINAYRAKYKEDPGYYTAAGYGAVQLYEQAIKAVGKVDREAIAQWLRTTRTTTAFGPYQVDETGRPVGARVYVVQWVNGSKFLVWPDEFAQAKPKLPIPSWHQR